MLNLSDIGIKNIIKVMMEGTNYSTYKDIAAAIGMKEYTFRSALHNNSLRLRDFQAIADLLGYQIKLEKKK